MRFFTAGSSSDLRTAALTLSTTSFVVANSPEQFATQMAEELAVYKKVVETAKLKLE